MSSQIDLGKIFQTVSSALADKQDVLNQADTYNQDHGDHMVEIFGVITQAMQEKRGDDPADQLAYASELLRRKSQSGSATLYADNLKQAASEFSGQQITGANAMDLVQTLLGRQAAPAESGNVLGSLLGGLLGGGEAESDSGIDTQDLLTAGMAFLSSKQRGESDMEALVDAVVMGSSVGQSSHRAQSGSIVANTLLQSISGLLTQPK